MTLVLKLRFVVAMLVVTVKEPASPEVPVSMNTVPKKHTISQKNEEKNTFLKFEYKK